MGPGFGAVRTFWRIGGCHQVDEDVPSLFVKTLLALCRIHFPDLAPNHAPPNILGAGVMPCCVSLRVWRYEMNYLRTAILLAGLTALFVGVGYLIGGPAGA